MAVGVGVTVGVSVGVFVGRGVFVGVRVGASVGPAAVALVATTSTVALGDTPTVGLRMTAVAGAPGVPVCSGSLVLTTGIEVGSGVGSDPPSEVMMNRAATPAISRTITKPPATSRMETPPLLFSAAGTAAAIGAGSAVLATGAGGAAAAAGSSPGTWTITAVILSLPPAWLALSMSSWLAASRLW